MCFNVHATESASYHHCDSRGSVVRNNTSWCGAVHPALSPSSVATSDDRCGGEISNYDLWCEAGCAYMLFVVGLALYTLGLNTNIGNEVHAAFSRHRVTGTMLAGIVLITTFTDSAVLASGEASVFAMTTAPALYGVTKPGITGPARRWPRVLIL